MRPKASGQLYFLYEVLLGPNLHVQEVTLMLKFPLRLVFYSLTWK